MRVPPATSFSSHRPDLKRSESEASLAGTAPTLYRTCLILGLMLVVGCVAYATYAAVGYRNAAKVKERLEKASEATRAEIAQIEQSIRAAEQAEQFYRQLETQLATSYPTASIYQAILSSIPEGFGILRAECQVNGKVLRVTLQLWSAASLNSMKVREIVSNLEALGYEVSDYLPRLSNDIVTTTFSVVLQ